MKKTMIVAPQTFVGAHFEKMIKTIDCLGEYKVFFFKNQEKMCEISDENALSNYHKIIGKLDEKGIEYRELPVYGFDELFYMMKSASFRSLFDDDGKSMLISPTDSSYYIGISANLQLYGGELSFIRRCVNNTIIPYQFRHANMHNNPKSLYTSLDQRNVDRDPKDDEYHFELNGKTYGGQIPHGSHQSGRTGFTFKDSYNHRIKIWHYETPVRQYMIDKIQKMIDAPDPKNISFPKALVYNSQNVPVGVVMENFEGESCENYNLFSVELKNPPKCMRSVMQNLVSSEMFSLIHSDFYHNLLFNGDESYIIDVEGCQFGQYPFSSWSTVMNNGIPKAYFCKGHFWSTCQLSYWAAYMSVSAFLIPGNENAPENDMLDFCYEDNEDYCLLNPEFMIRLKHYSSVLQNAIKMQYNNFLPIHPMRYYMILDSVVNNTEADTVLSDISGFVGEIGIDASRKSLDNFVRPELRKNEVPQKSNKPPTKIVGNVYDNEEDLGDTPEAEDNFGDTPDYGNDYGDTPEAADSGIPNGKDESRDEVETIDIEKANGPITVRDATEPPISIFPNNGKTRKQRKKLKEIIPEMWIHIVYLLFNERITQEAFDSVHRNSSGINVVSNGNTQQEKERKGYLVIKEMGLWKAPLKATIIAILISAAMLIIAHFMKIEPPQ